MKLTIDLLYVLWMYLLIQKAPLFDFIGMTSASPWYWYIPLAVLLMAGAAFARRRQLTTGRTSS